MFTFTPHVWLTSFFKTPLRSPVPPSRTQQTMVEQRAKELEDFQQMLRPETDTAFGEVLEIMGANVRRCSDKV